MKETEKKEYDSCGYLLIAVALFVLIIAICYTFYQIISSHFTNWAERGTVGDTFGIINALFSGFAFAGLIVTLFMQREELKMQRQELADTREEMKRQSSEFEQQNQNLALQRFDNTFFNMMSLQQQIVEGLTLHYTTNNQHNRLQGRDVFETCFCGLERLEGIKSIMYNRGIRGYEEFDILPLFDHYFRHLYTILKFIDNTKVFDDEKMREDGQSVEDAKYKYTSILRSTLSSYELVLVYYNGLSKNGVEKLKPLLEKYSMLNNLASSYLTLSKDSMDSIGVRNSYGADEILDEYGYSGTDYEFCLTTEINNHKKYNINAFERTQAGKERMISLLDKFNIDLPKIKQAIDIY